MIRKVLLLVSFLVPALQSATSNKILVENCPRWWGLSLEPSKHDEILCFLCHRFRPHLGHVYLAFLIMCLAISILLIAQHKTGQLLTKPHDLEARLKVLLLQFLESRVLFPSILSLSPSHMHSFAHWLFNSIKVGHGGSVQILDRKQLPDQSLGVF